MNIEHDKWMYVYSHSAQRAREFFKVPPETEVRLEKEADFGALPCWAVKVPQAKEEWRQGNFQTAEEAVKFFGLSEGTEVRQVELAGVGHRFPRWAVKVPSPLPVKEPRWSDKGKIRLECTLCGEQHDGVAAVPPGWTDVEEVRSFERATADVPDVRGVNEYGDTVWDWQTHLGVCPECREECRTEATETKKAIDAYREVNYVPSPDCPPPPPVAKPNREELSNRQLAVIAKGLLMDNGGFTLDEFGNSASGDLWAVSVEDKECTISGRPSIDELKAYLDRHPIVRPMGDAFFGGWEECDERGNVITHLDHTLLFAHKHTAVAEGLKNKQKAIYHLQTKETLELAEFGK